MKVYIYISNQGQGWPKTFRYQNKTCIKYHLAIKIIWPLYVLCLYYRGPHILGEHLQNHWSSSYPYRAIAITLEQITKNAKMIMLHPCLTAI